MGYSRTFQHDVFVSYAHAGTGMGEWGKALVASIRSTLAAMLRVDDDTLSFWMDPEIAGDEHLSDQLKRNVQGSALLLILVTDRYLNSRWCGKELSWFRDAPGRPRIDNKVQFLLAKVEPTDRRRWPAPFLDEDGHGITGFNFVSDEDASLPKGFPNIRDASEPDRQAFYQETRRIARAIKDQLTAIKAMEEAQRVVELPPPPQPIRPRVFLAAMPAEDAGLDDRAAMARVLAERFDVVPAANPEDADLIYAEAPGWTAQADMFVQVLGNLSGKVRPDDGIVMHQHRLAQQRSLPIHVYRPAWLAPGSIRNERHAEFVRSFEPAPGDLATFAQGVRTRQDAPGKGQAAPAASSIYLMTSNDERDYEQRLRRLAGEFGVKVLPLPRSDDAGRRIEQVIDDNAFMMILKRCGAIVLLHTSEGSKKAGWLDLHVMDILYDIRPRLGSDIPCLVVDSPPAPRLESQGDYRVLKTDLATFEQDLRQFLGLLKGASGLAGAA